LKVSGLKIRNKKPSIFYFIKVILNLIPIIINFKKDRRIWIRQEGKNVNEKKFRKNAEKMVKVFIGLGPSYIKLGQWLSSRADLLPQPYLEILARLQDEVPAAPFEEVKKIIEKDLGKLEDVFEDFNTNPISGASLGQVYLAKYNNSQVVVKVSRPNINQIIQKDIEILRKILPLATKFIDPNLRFSIEGMFLQFIETIYEEMDYTKEADNLLSIKKNLRDEKMVVIPRVYLERTSRHILTIEYIPGIKITDIKSLELKGIDREKIVVRIHHLFFKMLLKNSIFHADPHPGNISITNDGKIILYDFGMVGRIDNETRIKLVRLYLSLIEKNPRKTVDVLLELDTLEPGVNRNVVERAIELSIRSMHGKEVDKMEVKSLMELSNKTLSKFPFKLPKNLALYMRMSSILEGIYLHHQVKFQFVKVLRRLLEQEGLVKEAHIEELRKYVKNIWKNIENSQNTDILQMYIDDKIKNDEKIIRAYKNIGYCIFASAVFIGSAINFSANQTIASVGLISSFLVCIISILKIK